MLPVCFGNALFRRDCAERCTSRHWGFAIATRLADEHGDAAVAGIQADGGTIVGLGGSIADKETAEQLVDHAVSTYGRLDILCNNAGVMDYMQAVGELSDDAWRRVLRINLDGLMFTSRRAVPHMCKQGGGSIVNIASTAGISGAAAGAAYTASKHALVGLTRNTAWMYAQQGIRCNAICPGGTKTNIGGRCRTIASTRLVQRGSAGSLRSSPRCWSPPISRRWHSSLPRTRRI